MIPIYLVFFTTDSLDSEANLMGQFNIWKNHLYCPIKRDQNHLGTVIEAEGEEAVADTAADDEA